MATLLWMYRSSPYTVYAPAPSSTPSTYASGGWSASIATPPTDGQSPVAVKLGSGSTPAIYPVMKVSDSHGARFLATLDQVAVQVDTEPVAAAAGSSASA